MPTVSIIVPVYNIEEYIGACVRSLLSESFRNLEVILIDDGSNDRSGSICDSFAVIDDRVKVFHKENGGVGSARNAGLNLAVGDFIIFLDGDDIIYSGALQKIIPAVAERHADITMCDLLAFDNGTAVIYKPFKFDFDTKIMEAGDCAKVLSNLYKNGSVWNISRAVYNRRFLQTNSIFFETDINSCEDFDFHMKAYQKAQSFFAVKEPIFCYRKKRKGSLSTNKTSQFFIDTISTLAKWSFYLQQNYEYKDIKIVLNVIARTCYGEISDVFALKGIDGLEAAIATLEQNKDVLRHVNGIKRKIACLIYGTFGFKAGKRIYNMTHFLERV
ncbi:MAG: glycosyltransferase family 2 protein [Bacillota bacterium]|nr:glycosyltransferase family 2 protein [Bacillota bacterium]